MKEQIEKLLEQLYDFQEDSLGIYNNPESLGIPDDVISKLLEATFWIDQYNLAVQSKQDWAKEFKDNLPVDKYTNLINLKKL